jgi:class 3 adenylate cyclase/tetratricopeptide (TPR) repeat protein
MRCPRCQHDNLPAAKFCQECATPLARSCTNCGSQLPPSAKFCPECAHPAGAVAASQGRFHAPESYTPKHLAERILTSKAALEGERKQVTILFADLKGSMELLADRDPEEARTILDPVLERMMEAVHRYEGTVNQVMGDGIMALFGAPLAHEDHAVRACYAALRMQETVKRYADELRQAQGVAVRIRVGLNSGEVVVRTIGSDLRMDYTAVGQTTHLAARMEQLADPGGTLLTSKTLHLTEGYVEVAPLGPIPVKGLAEPVEVFELTRAGAARSRFHAGAARGLTRFVGRDAELEQLRQALERAAAGHGQVVAVVGEPGAGKSRLYWEFTHSHRTEGWLVLEAGSVAYGKASAYLPVVDLLKRYFLIEARDDIRHIREKVTGKLLALDRQLEPWLPALLSLLDLAVDDPQWERLDPHEHRQLMHDAIKRLLLRESGERPLILQFEDLHWIDAETQAVLDALVDSVPTARIVLLVNYRPEYEHRWGSRACYRQLRIDPLPANHAEELLSTLLGTDPRLLALKRWLVDQTDGNPFFLEESVQALVESRALIGTPGAYRQDRQIEELEIPASVQSVLAARIDRLLPEDKRLLQTAAIIGKDVPLGLLRAVAEESADDIRATLARLQTAEFLYEVRLFPEIDYTFKHALTHGVAYDGVLHERRRRLHGRVVQAIERLYPDRADEHVELLAHHAARAELWSAAARYLRLAGDKALARSANADARRYFEHAIEALRRLPNTREVSEASIDVHMELRIANFPLGDFNAVHDHLEEAERIARDIADQQRLGWAWVFMGHYFWAVGQARRAREYTRAARTLAHETGNAMLAVPADHYTAAACHVLGDLHEAEHLLRDLVARLQGDLARGRFRMTAFPAVISRAWLAWVLADLGSFDEAVSVAREAINFGRELDHPHSLVSAYWLLGHTHVRRGDLALAAEALENALLLTTSSYRVWFAPVAAPLGWVRVLLGRHDGLELIEEAVAQSSTGNRVVLALDKIFLAEALVAIGRLDDATRVAEEARSLSQAEGRRADEASAIHLFADMALLRPLPDYESAEGGYRAALARAAELGMRPLVAHCHLGLGKLYRRTGKRQEAREHLTTATTMYREMDMRFYLEQAVATMRQRN